MITSGKNSQLYGQFQEYDYNIQNDLQINFNDNKLLIGDKLRIVLDQGLLKFSVKQEDGTWSDNSTLTDSNIEQPSDIPRVPQTPSSTFLSMDNDQMKVYILNVVKMLMTGNRLELNDVELQLNNSINDFVIRLKNNNNQKLLLKDTSDSTLLEVNKQNVHLHNKPLLGVADSTDLSSAISLQKLKDYKGQGLKIQGATNSANIVNTFNEVLFEVKPSVTNSYQEMRYETRPTLFANKTIVDKQFVDDTLQSYQAISQKNKANGYASLDSTARIQSAYLPVNAVKIQANVLQSNTNNVLTTDSLQEGTNLYFTNERVQDVISQQKGQSNGLCPLDAQSKIPSQYIGSIQVGTIYSGLDAQKTQSSYYGQQVPQIGDRFVATDTNKLYLLIQSNYQLIGSWSGIALDGVQSVNSQTGVVNLSTNEIPETLQNQYFASGMSDYLQQSTNQQDQLLKLNSNATIDSAYLQNPLSINSSGFAYIYDNGVSLDFQRQQGQSSIVSIQNSKVLFNVPIEYDQDYEITEDFEIVHKKHVDTLLSSFKPSGLLSQDATVSLNTQQGNIQTIINESEIYTLTDQVGSYKVPIVYDQQVAMISPYTLVTKEYVDSTISNFINQSGSVKQYIQAANNVTLTGDGIIGAWNILLSSDIQDNITVNNNGTITLEAGVYKIHLDVKVSNFAGQLQIRNNTSNQVLQSSDDTSLVILQDLDQQTTLDIYIVNNDQVNSYNYQGYLLLEEMKNLDIAVGQNQINDPGMFSKVEATNNYIETVVNNVNVHNSTEDGIVLDQGKHVIYNSNTTITNDNQLITKKYLDQSLDLAQKSISDIGQVLQISMSSNQSIQTGSIVAFDTVLTNNSQTMQLDSQTNSITFTNGFMYKIHYRMGLRFSQAGNAQFVFEDVATGNQVSQSIVYVTYNTADNTQPTATFFIDLRNEQNPVTYQVKCIQQYNLANIYRTFTFLNVEQIQIIGNVAFDKINSINNETIIKTNPTDIQLQIDNVPLLTINKDVSDNIVHSLQSNTQSFIVKEADTATIEVSNDQSSSIKLQADGQTNKLVSSSANPLTINHNTQNIIELDTSSMNSYVPIAYDQNVAINSGSQLTTRDYNDSRYFQSSNFADNSTHLTSTVPILYSNVNISNDNHLVTRIFCDNRYFRTTNITDNSTYFTSNIPIQYDQSVSITNDNQLTNRLYNDNRYLQSTNISDNTTQLNTLIPIEYDQAVNITNDNQLTNRLYNDNRYLQSTNITDNTSQLDALIPVKYDQQVVINNDQHLTTKGYNDTRYLQSTNISDNATQLDTLVPIVYDNSIVINNDYQLVSKIYSDNRYVLQTTSLDQLAQPVSSLNMNSNSIINVTDPVNAQDVATKNYVDQQGSGGQSISFTSSYPIGSIVAIPDQLSSIPQGFLECNGQAIDQLTYPDLYAIMQVTPTIQDIGLSGEQIYQAFLPSAGSYVLPTKSWNQVKQETAYISISVDINSGNIFNRVFHVDNILQSKELELYRNPGNTTWITIRPDNLSTGDFTLLISGFSINSLTIKYMNYNSKFIIAAANFTSNFPNNVVADVDMVNNKIINVANPTNAQDAVTLSYVQSNYDKQLSKKIYISSTNTSSISNLTYVLYGNPNTYNINNGSIQLNSISQQYDEGVQSNEQLAGITLQAGKYEFILNGELQAQCDSFMIVDNNGIVYGNKKQIPNAIESINLVTEINTQQTIFIIFALDNLTQLTQFDAELIIKQLV